MSSEKIIRQWSRRNVLKLGAACGIVVGAPYIVTSKKSALIADSYAATGGLTPFVAPLPIPVVKTPVEELDPEPITTRFQQYRRFPAKEFYEINVREALHSFHPQLPLNPIWGYDGTVPGPLFHARYGRPMIVRFRNNLPPISRGFGDPSIITHLHNGHTASESDGFAGDFYPPAANAREHEDDEHRGSFKDHHYPHMLAGNDPREALNTLWYHDHRVDFTAQNIYKGLAGSFFLFDELDSGDETDPNPKAFRLPSGPYDVPIMLVDRSFDSNGALYFNPTDLNGFIGDTFTVNGAVQPYFKVARRKYRLRVLNASSSRIYGITLSNGQPFQLVATDGNMLDAPVTLTQFVIAPAERFDIVVDFSSQRIGDQIVLQSFLGHINGRGPAPGRLAVPLQLMRFDVDRNAADPSQVPAALRPYPPINLNEVVRTRTWNFENENGAWTVNGRLFDLNRVDAVIKRGTAEIWELNGGSGPDWAHPIHVHLEEFRILSRDGGGVPIDERGRKDVVKLASRRNVRLFIRFRDMLGKYMMHCHNTVHEDHAMMVRFDVVP